MSILKIAAVVAVLFVIYLVFFRKSRNDQVQTNHRRDNDEIEDIMVECTKCGTYVSKKEAILSNGHYFCSKECLKK